ncbi:MAG TPA: peptidoglycan DD-metalloendopeptidase family protein, partial [Ilumatobacteraceae bacterium]|nr:peptidoglycan DD-metalloendopeptidase family protein [Ilumatobacteraceae bacterium]
MSSRVGPTRGLLLVAGLAVLAAVVDPTAARPAHAARCWFPPVVGVVADPYRQPPCPWCAGNRGIDYRVGDDVVVRAAESGRVVFVGTVVGVRYVVIQIAGGWRHTYGQLTSSPLVIDDVVLANTVVGRASDAFFFGLRIGDDYADPAPFIGTLRTRARLIPVDGTAARPAPPARPRCAQVTHVGDPGTAR